MEPSEPLTGISLVDCAKSNAKQGLEVAAQRCGYGRDTTQFMQRLRTACQEIGVEIQELDNLITEQPTPNRIGVEFTPVSRAQF